MCHGQILSDAIRRARKQHRCEECGRVIAAGEKYRTYSWKESVGDEPRTGKQCARCVAFMAAAFDSSDEACFTVGDIRSFLAETIDGCATAARRARRIIRNTMEKFK